MSGHESGWRGALKGFFHAHIGWVFSDMEVADERIYAKDLLADPWVRFVDRTFVLWVFVGLGLSLRARRGPHRHGHGRADRLPVGRRGPHLPAAPLDVRHQLGLPLLRAAATSRPGTSRATCPWLAIPTWGEAWHNNHHAFPTSYRHGLRRWQIDPSAGDIRLLEMFGLAWDVVRVDPERIARRAAAAVNP